MGILNVTKNKTVLTMCKLLFLGMGAPKPGDDLADLESTLPDVQHLNLKGQWVREDYVKQCEEEAVPPGRASLGSGSRAGSLATPHQSTRQSVLGSKPRRSRFPVAAGIHLHGRCLPNGGT